jgi:hypothetical protein
VKGLIALITVYTITFFWFGMWIQSRVDQWQLQKYEEAAFSDGCKKCAQFEKAACDRDQLQGGEGFSQVP